MAFMDKMKDNVLPLSASVLVAGIVFFTLSLLWAIRDSIKWINDTVLKGYFDTVNVWNWWILVISSIAIFMGGMYLYTYFRDSRSFNKLIDTSSKSTFRKNLDELEDLSWKLPSSFRKRLLEKKEQLKVK